MIDMDELRRIARVTTVGVTTHPETWTKFLGFAAQHQKPYLEMITLYAHQQNATDARTFEEWTSEGAHIRKGSRGIPVIRQYRDRFEGAYLFDAKDVWNYLAQPNKMDIQAMSEEKQKAVAMEFQK